MLIAATLATPVMASGNHFTSPAENVRPHIYVDKNIQKRHQFKQHRLDARQIKRILIQRGYTNINNLRFDGRTYQAKARGKRGNIVRLTIDARNGNILNRTIVRKVRPNHNGNWRPNNHAPKARLTFEWNQSRSPFWRN